MKKILFFVVFAICSALFIITSASPAHAARQLQEETTLTPIPLIVGLGQSNMAGGLEIDGNTVIVTLTNVKMMKHNATPSVNTWNWNSDMKEPSSVWEFDPTHTPQAKFKKYGPATSFMQQLMAIMTARQTNPWSKAAFINCAVGGSSVASWVPTPAAPLEPNLDNCWLRIKSALMNLQNDYYVAGFVVVNGETDTKTLDNANNYKTNFDTMYDTLFSRIKTFENNPTMPSIPMVFARLGNVPAKPYPSAPSLYPYWADIQQDQYQLAQGSRSSYWEVVGTVGLPRQLVDANGDPLDPNEYDLHYTKAGYDTLGIRLANALAPMLP